MNILATDFDNALFQAASLLKQAPECSPRGLKIVELICPVITIEHPERCVCTNTARKLSLQYLNAELYWYLKGWKSASFIEKYASMWRHIQNEDGTVNSNYGYFVFHQPIEYYGTQFQFVADSLRSDKDSRQALINYNQPTHKYHGNLDFVCTISQQFLIRNNELICINTVRSNDLIYGMCYDMPFFSLVQQLLYYMLKGNYPDLKLGRMIHIPASLHVYEKHYQMLNDIIDAYATEHNESALLEGIDSQHDAYAILADIQQGNDSSNLMTNIRKHL